MKKNAFFRAGLLLLSINIFFGEKLFSQNLLQNGGFECGGKGTGFNINSSFYTDVTSSLPKASSNVGDYAVTNDPYNLNSSTFLHGTDHSGSGKMLVCDGITTGGQQIFWQAGSSGGGICGLTVGATYYFSYWVKSVSSTCTDPSTCASLAVKFNNNSGGQWPAPTTGSQMVGLPAAGWQQVIYTFVPTNACVNIEITNNNTNSVGNDFALDDMSVVAAVQPPLSLTQTHTSPTCYIKGSDATDGTDGTIFGYASGGSSPYTFNLTSTNLTPTVSLSNGSGAFTGLLSGTYNLSVTDSKSATVSLTGIVLGHLEDTLKTGNDTSICLGGSANLSVTGGYNIPYVWSPSGSLTGSNSNPVATPGSTTTYLIHSDTTITITSSQNLITNGDFEAGNSGFYSDYTFNNNNTTLAQKVYGIVTNPQTFESGFTACATHGGTKQLVADGSTFLCGSSASDKIWAQTVNVVPGTTYTLTYYAQTVSAAGNPAQLSVKINGTTVGATAIPSSAACNWLTVTNTWTAPVGVTAAEIALYDLNSVASGNDFAIDDISFIGTSTVTKNCKLTDSIKVTVLTPQAPVINCGTLTTSSVQFNWNTIAGATSYDYSYQINSGTPSAVQNTTSTTVTISSGVAAGDNVTITITPKGTGCFTSNTQTCTAQNCPVNTVTPASAAPTLCINTPLTSITHTTTGATGIGAATGLPTGVTAAWNANTITISGTPTAAGTFNYTIPLTGGCGAVNATGTINVTNVNTVTTASSAPTLCINTPLTSITHTTTGATGIGTATGLPTGVTATWNANTITISGTPTAAGTFNYTIPLTGGCGAVNATGTINVTNVNTVSAASSAPTLCINTPLTSITHTTTGATGIGTATGLPTGVTAAWNANTITISGTPTAAGTFNYSIPLTGGCGAVSATGTINVTNVNTVTAASSAPTLCINTSLTSITHTTTGATGIGTATGLPTGVTAAWNANTITISGTPTAAGTFNYSIPLTGGCGAVSATGTITVITVNTASIASATPNLCINTALTNITHTTTGATGIGTATGLPTGVTAAWNANTITISGTPTAAGTFNYTIPLSGGCGAVSATGTINVTNTNTVSAASSAPTLCINTPLTSITHTTTGATGIGAATGLPTGVTAAWNANTITISGTPTAAGTFNYTIPLTGGCGAVNATGTINVTNVNTVNAASSAPTLCINTPLTSITHTTTGATGIGAATGLPTGVTAAWNANTITISGTPTAAGTFNYTIPLTGGCGAVSATGTITVTNVNTVSVASSAPTLCINTTLTNITHTTTGATGIGAATGLPTGVTAAWNANTITISGTPTAAGTFNYSIPLTGGCGAVSATGTITVTNVNTVTTASSAPTLCINTTLTNITHTTTGATGIGAATGLPTGVTATWNANTITISGTPTAAGTFNYSIPLTGGCGNIAAAGSIIVRALPNATITGTTTVCQNATTPNITFTGSGGTSPYTFTYNINGGSSQTVSTTGANSSVTVPVSTSTSGPNTYNILSVADGAATSCSANISGQSATVTVIGTPATPTASVTVQPTCTTNGTIVITSPTGAGLEYSIDGSNYQSSTTFSGLTPATYNVTARTTTGQCVSAPLSLTVNAPPGAPAAPTASVTTQPTCIITTGTITITAPTGATLQYTKDGTNYQTGTTFTGLTPGLTYNINVKDFSSGCVSAATALTINNIPANPATPTAGVTVQPDCANPNGTIVVTAPTGASIQYSIDGSNYQSSGTFPGLNPGNTYNITAKNTSTGCVSSAATLTINSIPGAPAAPTASITQQPNCNTPTGTIIITAPIGANFQYSNGGAYQSGTSFTGLTPGNTYNITVKNTTTGCVSNSTILTINVLPANPAAPTANVTQQPNCITPTGIITITAPIGANYEYSKGGAYQTGTTFTNLTPNTSYNITVKDISTGCISSATIVTINALPANPATPTASVTDAPSCITPTGTITVSNPTGNTIRYSIDGTSYQSSNIFSGLTPNQTYNITAKDVSTGCISSAKSITIPAIPANPATPTASVTQQPNCIAPTGTIAITAPTGSNIEYSIDGNAYQISNIFSGLTPGNSYSITAKNTLTGCISSPKNLNINSIPNGPAAPTVSVTAQPTCIIQTGTITITAPTGASILYTIDGNSYNSTKVYSGLLPGSSYTVIAKDNTTGCTSGPSVVNINEIPANPVVNAGPDKEIMQGQNATLNGQATGNGLTYVWTPNISISNAGVLTPTVNPTNDQVYTLTATSKDGCVASDNVKITVVKEIVVPNAFSPNEDNINDTWIIENINYYPNADIKIFNRYGQFVFESRGYQIPWDGTYKGQKVPVGTYFWIIKLKPDSKPRSGSVSVIR